MSLERSPEQVLNRARDTFGIEPLNFRPVDANGNSINSPNGTATNRQVTLADNTATEFTATADSTEVHLINNSGSTFRYGGGTVSATTGGLLFSGSTMVIKNPGSTFKLYFIQNSGGPLSLDVVEMY